MLTFLLVVLVAAIVAFAVVSQVLSRANPTRRRKPKRGTKVTHRGHVDRSRVAQRWMTLETVSRTGGGTGLKSAVMDADKLLDYVLRESGAPGENMGERLKAWGGHFSDTNAVWRAHKLRNTLAHEVEFDIVASQAREAIADFKRALQDLGALS